MKDLKPFLPYIILSVIITIIVMFLFWEQDATNLRDIIDIKEESIKELESQIDSKNSEIQSLTDKIDELESSIDTLSDTIYPSEDSESLYVEQ